MYDGVSVRQDFSGGGKILWWDVARLSQGPQRAPTVRSDGNPSDGSVFQADPKPSLRGQLKRPANKVSDDIGVTDDDVVRVLFLRLFGLGEVLLEGALDPGSVRAKLSRVWLPKVQRRFGRKRSAFLKQLVHGNGEGR